MSDPSLRKSHVLASEMNKLAKDFSRNRELMGKLSDRLTRAHGILTTVQQDFVRTQDEYDRIAKRVYDVMFERSVVEVLDNRPAKN